MRPILFAVLALFATATCSSAQSCRSRSYSTYGYSYTPSYSYSYTPSYSYAAPSYSYAAPKVEKAYKEDYVYQKFLAVLPLVELPTYSAVYQQPQAQKANPAAAQQSDGAHAQILSALDRVERRLDQIDQRVGNLERAGRFGAPKPLAQPEPEPIPKQPKKEDEQAQAKGQAKLTAASVNQQRCAACHQEGNQEHGGDFILSDVKGQIRPLSDRDLRSMGRVLARGSMPKLGKRATEHGITQPLSKEEMEALYSELDRQILLEAKQ